MMLFSGIMKMSYSLFGVILIKVYAIVKTHEIENLISCMLFYVNYTSIGLFIRNIYNIPCA